MKTVTNEEVTAGELGGARTHTRTSGVSHLSFENDVAAMAATRELVAMLPSSNREPPPCRATEVGSANWNTIPNPIRKCGEDKHRTSSTLTLPL